MSNKVVFNEIISDYAFGRPGYPDELFRDVLAFAKLRPDAEILEIGAGPGQATDYFVKHGYSVTALEIGKAQVDYLACKYAAYPHFHAVLSSFEDYEVPNGTVDLIFSATAFHWVDPAIGYPKAYRLLKKNGVMAVFWHLESVIRQQTELNDELSRIFQTYAPQLDSYITPEEGTTMHELRISQIQTDNLFENPETKLYHWNEEYSTERYLRLLNSYSDLHEIDEEKRSSVFKSVSNYFKSRGGNSVVPLEVRLYMAMK